VALDSLTKRAAVMGVARPWMRSKNPDATLSEPWRVATGNAYPVALFGVAISAAISGSATESQLVAGGQVFTITLSNDTFIAAGTGPIGSIANTQALIDGIVSAQAEANGWNAERSNIAVTDLVRTSDTVATLTLPALSNYVITADEVLTWTVPAVVLTAVTEVIGAPTIGITNEDVATGGGHFIPGLAGVRAGRRKPEKALDVAETILDEIVAEVLDTPKKPVERVSRRLKSRIIEIATQRLLDERVLIGEINAIDRAAVSLAKLAIKRRIETRKLPEIIPDNDQDIAAMMFRLLNEDDPQRVQDEELILLMQILLML